MLDLRAEFPQFQQKPHGRPWVYLDSAATTLKPQVVIDRLTKYYSAEVSNVHRGAHYFSNLATQNYEQTRSDIARYLDAKDEEIVFTSGTTDALNLLSYALETEVKTSTRNEILLTEAEHHSNIVPWYWFAQKHNLKIKVLPIDPQTGLLLTEKLEDFLTEKTFLCSMVHMSNTLGTINNIKEICDLARQKGAFSIIDAAQSVSYMDISVKEIGCDFLCFSTHKLFGPEGLGILYGKKDLLNQIGFYKGGGSMIANVAFDKISFLDSPQKFEAGTPAIGSVIAFAEALKFFRQISKAELQVYEKMLLKTTDSLLQEIPGYTPVGEVEYKNNILSFNLEGCHPSDLGALMDEMGVAVRVGHHCTQPLINKFEKTATVRASFSIYNNEQDCVRFVEAIKKAREMLL